MLRWTKHVSGDLIGGLLSLSVGGLLYQTIVPALDADVASLPAN